MGRERIRTHGAATHPGVIICVFNQRAPERGRPPTPGCYPALESRLQLIGCSESRHPYWMAGISRSSLCAWPLCPLQAQVEMRVALPHKPVPCCAVSVWSLSPASFLKLLVSPSPKCPFVC